ncbi:RpiB/LacA/LacB family sugar-phosphate isomerase [bacterium]|nr:MAG: RpiB/LacA/LacB family sugar-phosphate isomerase [bacterium]
MIYLGADHGGFQLKEEIGHFLSDRGYQVKDMGTNSEELVDYPVFAAAVANKVVEDPNNRGILVCRNGVGMCMAANKIPGIRAGQLWDEKVAVSARNDDNINVACIGSDMTSADDAKKILGKFLDTSFGGTERYSRRLKLVTDLEKKK